MSKEEKKIEDDVAKRVFRYYKLFDLLNKRHMQQQELEVKAGVSASTMNKLKHGKNVNTEMLEKICTALECNLEDIVETEKEGDEE